MLLRDARKLISIYWFIANKFSQFYLFYVMKLLFSTQYKKKKLKKEQNSRKSACKGSDKSFTFRALKKKKKEI